MSNIIRAGAAKINVTPTPDYFPVFNKTNGIGGGPDSIFIRAHDDVFIRAMAIENDSERIIIISPDWGGLDTLEDCGEMYFEAAAKGAGIPIDNVMIVPTHDHNCFDIGRAVRRREIDPDFYHKAERYQKFAVEALEQVAREAVEALRPAKIGFGKTKCYANVSRHCYSETGAPSIAGFERDRPSDRDLIVLNVRDLDDKPIGVLYNYGCHASLLANNKPDGVHTELSGDWPGYCSRKIEEKLGNGAVALYLAGGGGDQNAIMISRVYKVRPDGSGEMFDFGPTAYIILDFISDMICRDTMKAIESVDKYKTETRIWSRKRTYPADPSFLDFDDGKQKGKFPFQRPMQMDFTLMMLGDIALAASNGEIYSQISMRFKEDSPYRKTLFMSMAGHFFGYIKDDSGNGKAEKLIRSSLYDMMEEYSDGK